MKKSIIKPSVTIRQAMKQLNKSGQKCLVITDEKNVLLGTLSDGDVRKAILKGVAIENSIEPIFNHKPKFLVENKYSLAEAKELFVKNRFDLIPVVNGKNVIVDILFLESVLNGGYSRKKKKFDVPVAIMAGGKGTRLEPFTTILPKPLVPVHEKPIIEHIIERFTEVGCFEFYLTVNYKAKILKAYFEELQPDYNVNF